MTPWVDALYIRLLEGAVECEMIRLNDRVAISVGPEELIVGIEVINSSVVLHRIGKNKVQPGNWVADLSVQCSC